MMQAVILAAGRGRRLDPVSNGTPKCLVRVGGESLIERQLKILEHLGIDRIIVVVGYQHEKIRAVVGDRCDYIFNKRFDETNSLYSLWLAQHWVTGSFALMNCDVLAHRDIYQRVMAAHGCALAFDSSSGSDDEHMKVSVRDEVVHALGKELPADHVDGENVGVLKFDRLGARLLFQEADWLIRSGAELDWAPAAVDRLARRVPIRAVDIADLPWTEIDCPGDLQVAAQYILPAIMLNGSSWLDRRTTPHAVSALPAQGPTGANGASMPARDLL